MPYRRAYHEGNTTTRASSSTDGSDMSDRQPSSVAWQKRKADSGIDTVESVHGGEQARKKSSSPLGKTYQVDGEHDTPAYMKGCRD